MLEMIAQRIKESQGLISLLGIHVGVDGDEVECSLLLTDQHVGGPGVAHGGAITALLDSALGLHALRYALENQRFTSTVELKVNFLKPAKIGTQLDTEVRIESAGKSLVVLSGIAKDRETGEKIAFATGTFNMWGEERYKRVASTQAQA